MAEKRFTNGSEEWQMFQDYWKLCQMLWEPEDNDDYWQYTEDMTNKFLKKYNSDFTSALALAMTDELQRRYVKLLKKEKENGKG